MGKYRVFTTDFLIGKSKTWLNGAPIGKVIKSIESNGVLPLGGVSKANFMHTWSPHFQAYKRANGGDHVTSAEEKFLANISRTLIKP